MYICTGKHSTNLYCNTNKYYNHALKIFLYIILIDMVKNFIHTKIVSTYNK